MLAHCTEKLECLPPINPFADIYVFYSRDLCCGFSESRKRRSQTFIFHFLPWKPFIVICLVLWTWHTLLEKWDWARQVNEGVYHCHVYYLLFRYGFYNYISGCFCVPITVLGLERWIDLQVLYNLIKIDQWPWKNFWLKAPRLVNGKFREKNGTQFLVWRSSVACNSTQRRDISQQAWPPGVMSHPECYKPGFPLSPYSVKS